ncbi:MAG: hypothetical protein Kow00108_04550 [Calditrichia bacterium]
MKSLKFIILVVLFWNLLFGQGLEDKLARPVTLSYKDTPIHLLFRIMSKNYDFNYVISDIGDERVTVNVINVPLRQALNAILLPLGYHYFEQDSVLVIKSIGKSPSNELQSFVYRCKYKTANYLLNYIRPLLSENGSLIELGEIDKVAQDETLGLTKIQARTQMLLIRDIDNRIQDVIRVLNEIDKPEKQILIEVKLIERLIGDDVKAGLNWPTRVGVSSKSFPPKDQQALGGGGGGQQQEEFTGWFKDLPEVSDQFQWGIIAIDQIEAFVQLMGADNNSKIIANPKIATSNNEPAIVNIATTIPIQQIQRSAQGDIISFEDKNVSSFIEVLPVINPDNSLTLTIHPVLEEITGYVGSGDFPQPIVAKRELKTKVNINPDEAVVVGGLIKETESKVVNKIFLLGDIPILGYLFKHTSVQKSKSDLVIIVTPKVLE